VANTSEPYQRYTHLAKIEAGKLELTNPVNFRIFLDTSLLSSVARSGQGPDFMFEASNVLPWEFLWMRPLARVLLNLLDNAIKFTNEGRVTFRVLRRMPASRRKTASDRDGLASV